MSKLNLCFDGRILLNEITNNAGRTGIFFVAKNIVKVLKSRDINLFLYFDNLDDAAVQVVEKLSLQIKKENILFRDSDFSEINAFLSPVFSIPEEIYSFPSVSQYLILHDITPLLLPDYFIGNEPSWFYDICNKIDYDKNYFSISEHTKRDFLKFFPKISKENITVIPLSTNCEYKMNNNVGMLNKVKEKYHIPQKKYLFSLCSLGPRKNLIRAVRSFINFIQKNEINDLVYVLGGGAWSGFIEKLESECPDFCKHKDKIIKAGYIDDEDLEVLYSNAEWFVYTSQYEGFGMPPLEAMKCGCPVITSNNSSLPEVVGDSAMKIDFDSDEQHIEAYEKYYFDEHLRQEMSQKGLERAKLFSWDRCVDVILDKMYQVEEKKSHKPLVTIITPTYNLLDGGRKDWFIQNLESVQSQTYKNIEQIVIDGASTDGTVELLQEYQNKGWIKYYSEPDNGIYDALNKGILKANGKYVVCLNSDDYYCNNRAVEFEVMKLEESDADACYGDSLRVHPDTLMVLAHWKGRENFYPLFGAAPCHQSFMIKTDVMRELGLYNTSYKVSADNNFFVRMIQYDKKFIGINLNIIHFRDGGYSNSHFETSERERMCGFWEEYGQYHHLTKLDCDYLFGRKFVSLPVDKAIELGCKIDNKDWQKEYFRILIGSKPDSQNKIKEQVVPVLLKQKKFQSFKNFLMLKFPHLYKWLKIIYYKIKLSKK